MNVCNDDFRREVIVNVRKMLLWVQRVPGGPYKHEYMYMFTAHG